MSVAYPRCRGASGPSGAVCVPGCVCRQIGGAVIPHGDFAFDPSLVNFENGSREVHDAAVATGKWLCGQAPDVILLSTPHGMAADVPFALFGNTNASGFALLGSDLHNASFPLYSVPLNASMDPELAAALTAAVRASNPNVRRSPWLGRWGGWYDFHRQWFDAVKLAAGCY